MTFHSDHNSHARIHLLIKQSPPSCRLKDRTPVINYQSHSFSRRYGAILPTSLNYFVLSTRGFKPWRPDAVMGTNVHTFNPAPWIFRGSHKHIKFLEMKETLPPSAPYLKAKFFKGRKVLARTENANWDPCPLVRATNDYSCICVLVFEYWQNYLSRIADRHTTQVPFVIKSRLTHV